MEQVAAVEKRRKFDDRKSTKQRPQLFVPFRVPVNPFDDQTR